MARGSRPWHAVAEAIALPALALGGALLLFGVFVRLSGVNPVDAWLLLFQGAFGDAFSWQNTLQRAAPLIAQPAQPTNRRSSSSGGGWRAMCARIG